MSDSGEEAVISFLTSITQCHFGSSVSKCLYLALSHFAAANRGVSVGTELLGSITMVRFGTTICSSWKPRAHLMLRIFKPNDPSTCDAVT